MQTYTVLLSVLVHAVVVAITVVAPIIANDELPEPRRTTSFVIVTPVVPSPPAVVRASRPRSSPHGAPLTPPSGIAPERVVAPEDPFEVPAPGAVVPGDAALLPPPSPPPPSPPPAVAPIRVGGNIRPPQKIVHVAPEYPAIARAARSSGVVILEALIGEDGNVRDVRVLRSLPLLDAAAIAAVRQWRFTPTLLNGEAVPIVMTVTVSFALN
jgi:periplasmic protein TonB